jgi:hypothetical protein
MKLDHKPRIAKYRHVGIAQIYPWRPHGAHRDFLLKLANNDGLQTSELVCNGSLVKCYDKQFGTVGFGSIDHCIKCRLGRRQELGETKSFYLDWSLKHLPVPDEEIAILSSLAALVRAELPEDLAEVDDTAGILAAYRVGYNSTVRWIESYGVDLILMFNGRIDILKGVMDAAIAKGIDFASYERSWFGDGMWLVPFNNCLGIKPMLDLSRKLAGRQLTQQQIMHAEDVIDRRVNRTGSNEWRDFQKQSADWSTDLRPEIGKAPEILVLPSSSYEYWGHPDFVTEWQNNFDALDSLQQKLGVPYSRFVIRGHPIWAERVGPCDGSKAEHHYRTFCAQRGIRYVSSSSKLHTSALIEACQMVVLNSGTSVIEAVWRGKPVISLTPSLYQASGVCATYTGHGQNFQIPNAVQQREGIIRFAYAVEKMIPTFVPYLKAVSSSQQTEFEGASFSDVVDQIAGNTLWLERKWTGEPGQMVPRRESVIEKMRGYVKVGDR